MLRETCYCNVKVVAKLLAYVPDKVYAVNESAFYRFPLVFAQWRVAT